jgi:predicted transglutaminase-like cysteine proteinase
MNRFHLENRKIARVPVFLFAAVLVYCACMTFSSAGEFALSKQILANVEQQHGKNARQRVTAWRNMINSNRDISDFEKLRKVNNFFNQMEFVNDIDHWGAEDYWATPLQMLSSNGGDCEDFSIAKYFTLRELGIPAKRMRLTYVKALKLNQAHMVLTYYAEPDADPLILDNLNNEISSATERDDLLPVYSFNSKGLWLAKSRGVNERVGRSEQLGHWQAVLARLDSEQVPLSR